MIDSWFTPVRDCLVEFGEALEVEVGVSEPAELPDSCSGAVISLTGESHTYLVGVLADAESRRQLTNVLLGGDDSESPSEEEMDDAIGEVINLAAGWMKNHVEGLESTIELGLPIWINGPPNLARALSHDLRGVRFGPSDLAIVLLKLPLSSEAARRRREERERERLEQEVRMAQKLEAVGQLAAGVAHEINTPTQYISDNLQFLIQSFEEMGGVFEQCLAIEPIASAGPLDAERAGALAAAITEADIEFLSEEIPRALQQSLEGARVVAKIVQGMKVFSHPGSEEKMRVDLNQAIDATASVSKNEWKFVADLELDLDPALPAVACFAGELNQVVLNMIVNAAHAMEGRSGEGMGTIRIKTSLGDDDHVVIQISDDGAGIPEAIQTKIFDPFFTTKGVGKGTGQGLSIARQVIVDKHGGKIDVTSEVGHGTTFTIELPLGS